MLRMVIRERERRSRRNTLLVKWPMSKRQNALTISVCHSCIGDSRDLANLCMQASASSTPRTFGSVEYVGLFLQRYLALRTRTVYADLFDTRF